jgi:hypothetical protein
MDLAHLRPVYEEPGPYLTFHLDVGRATEDAQAQSDARWTTIRHDLEHARVPAPLVETIEQRLRENTHLPGEVRRTVIAGRDRVLLDDVQVGHNPHAEVVDRGPLPDLAPWLDQEDQALAFVLVVADRTGADIEVHRAVSEAPQHREHVTGETFYISKVAEGDWAQKQFQQTAENTWRHNARLVAETVVRLARGHRALTVLVAGEVRARSEVVDAIMREDHGLARVVEIESGGRAEGASADALWHEVYQRLREMVAARDADTVALLDEARGRGTGAATGLTEVLDALAQGQVDTLIADLETVRELTVRPGEHPGLAMPPGIDPDAELPADRVLIASAALTGARVDLVPAAMAHGGGVSALLRWENLA